MSLSPSNTTAHRGPDGTSATGVLQGDPLGSAAFALGVGACARATKSPLNVWYLDDATIAGPADVVQSDLQSLAKALPELGLQLNPAKCEVTVIDAAPQPVRDAAVNSIRSVLPEITETPLHSVTLLGAPLQDTSLTTAVKGAADLIRRLCTRLKHLDRHTGLFFLVHCVSAPRLLYLFRSAPLYKMLPALKLVDELVRETLVDKAKLPLRLRGLGVRSVEDLALLYCISARRSPPPPQHLSGAAFSQRCATHPADSHTPVFKGDRDRRAAVFLSCQQPEGMRHSVSHCGPRSNGRLGQPAAPGTPGRR